MTEGLLDREQLRLAFLSLADKLARRGLVGEIHVFGGAAMLLLFDGRAATRDVDTLFQPDGPMLKAAREVADELGLPKSWLNQASSYVSGRVGTGSPVFDHPNLRVLTSPPDHLLAMKVRAARSVRDAADIRLLLERLGIRSRGEVVAVVERYFPDDPLSDRSLLLLEDLIAE